jgi:phosphate transport system permease protein
MEQVASAKRSLKEELIQPERKMLRIEKQGKIITFLCAWILIVTLFSLIWFIASKGIAPFFRNEITLSEFFSLQWGPAISPEQGGPFYGVLAFVYGSLAVAAGAVIISAPLGIGAAIFMTEIAPGWGRKILQPVTEMLVGIPSVVYGFIGLTVIVPWIRSVAGGFGFGLLSGMLVLAVMILPTIISVGADAIQAVPKTVREGSYALGATRWQTISRLVVRSAMPGLMTGVVLGMARAFGEALAVQMVIGNAPNLPVSFTTPISTLTSVITLNMGNTVQGTTEQDVLWSMALILLLMTLIFIFLIRFISRRRED